MADEVNAMVQMVSITMNGAEKIFRGSWALGRALLKLLIMASMKIKQNIDLLPGEKTMLDFAKQGKPLQCLTMNAEQFKLFKAHSKEYNIQYHHINDKIGKKKDTVTVFIPESDAHKFNELVRKLNLNSVENLGTIKTEDINPDKAYNMNAMIEQSVNPEGVLSLTELRKNMVKSGMDADRADEILLDFADSPELEEAVKAGKVTNIVVDFPKEIKIEKIMEQEAPTEVTAPNPAETISADFEPFEPELEKTISISDRNWKLDKSCFEVEKQQCITAIESTPQTPANESFIENNQHRIERIDKILANDGTDLAAIEADPVLAEEYACVLSKFPSEPELDNSTIYEVESAVADTAEEVVTTVAAPKITPAVANAGTMPFDLIADDPSMIEGVIDVGAEVGQEIVKNVPGIDNL